MLSGVPVVTSDLTSIPEVGGDSVIYVDHFNEESIFQGMNRALKEGLDFSKKGLIQAKKFSWTIQHLKFNSSLKIYEIKF